MSASKAQRRFGDCYVINFVTLQVRIVRGEEGKSEDRTESFHQLLMKMQVSWEMLFAVQNTLFEEIKRENWEMFFIN